MVTMGIRLRELARLRIGLAASFTLACIAVALTSAYSVSLLPPGLTARVAETAGAHTQILVDDRRVSVLEAGFDINSFNDLHEGAVLAGSVMVQDPAREYIAQQAGIPAAAIEFSDPQVPIDPPLPEPSPPSRYSLTVAARPTVPILDVYAQAPTVAAARRLVDASVAGLRNYFAAPGDFGLRVTQLGRGAVVSAGAGGALTGALEVFLGVFVLGCLATRFLDRARRAWPAARQAAELASP